MISSNIMFPFFNSLKDVSTQFYHLQQQFYTIQRRCSIMPAEIDAIIEVAQKFKQLCDQYNLPIEADLAHFIVSLVSRDARWGLQFNELFTDCRIKRFLNRLISRYANSVDPTIANLKMVYFYRNQPMLDPKGVKEKFEKYFAKKLTALSNDILKHPENCVEEQIESMKRKIEKFVVFNYFFGCPADHVIMEETHKAMLRVVPHKLFVDFVKKKKLQRESLLNEITTLVCGSMVYYNHGPKGDKVHMRDIYSELDDLIYECRVSFRKALQRANNIKMTGANALKQHIEIDVRRRVIRYKWPLEKVREVNKFVALFGVYERFMRELIEHFEKIAHSADVGKSKIDCAVQKLDQIHDNLSIVKKELVVPHVRFMADAWLSLILASNCLIELQNYKSKIDAFCSVELEEKFREMIKTIQVKQKKMTYSRIKTFDELNQRFNRRDPFLNSIILRMESKQYCTTTISLTDGLLVPATVRKQLCHDTDLILGFCNFEFSKYAERYFEDYLPSLRKSIVTSVDMLLLFDLDRHAMEYSVHATPTKLERKGMKDAASTQTEFFAENDLTIKNRINFTWNIWDYYRETIHLAEMRKRQTKPAQTLFTYSQREAQSQANNTRTHI